MIPINFLRIDNKTVLRTVKIISVAVFLQSCATPSGISINPDKLSIPSQWQTSNNNVEKVSINDFETWLNEFADSQLNDAVVKALNYNRDLATERITLAIAKEKLTETKADNYPEISLGLNNRRDKTVSDSSASNNVVNYASSSSLSANLSYELDVWGKLSAQQKQSQLNYAAAQAKFNQQKVNVVTNVIKQWYNIVEANKLLELYKERSDNLTKNLEMIESSYKLGLGEALDVYLTKNTVTSELANVAQQTHAVKVATRKLELLLGEYPTGILESNANLLNIKRNIYVNSPSSILTQRQDIQASWFELLAVDSGLAVAHKQRFPSLSLSASTSDSSSELSNLLSGNALAWSLIGNITAPIFNGGRLASLEEQARLSVIKQEQTYLTNVYSAFAEVEDVLSNHSTLLKRYTLLEQAEMNALAAQKLSFDQYMRGIVTYTTVLEAERRAFDAQTSLIQIKNELIQNRADTFLVLGGVVNSEFSPSIKKSINKQDK